MVPAQEIPVVRRSLCSLVMLVAAGVANAQEPYRTPPDVVQRILDAPRLPSVSPSPRGMPLLLAEPAGLPGIVDLSQPMLRLAGRRINPATNGAFTTFRGFVSLTLQDTAGGSRPIAVPENAAIGGVAWSPDGRWIAFTHTTDDGIALWVADVATAAARALTKPVLNGTMGTPCRWMPNSAAMLCRLVPADRGAPPAPPRVPIGPIVQRNEGQKAPVRTYQDLLSSPHDEALFTYYATSQLVLVDVASGTATAVGQPAIFLDADPAPGGRHVLVERVTTPFSYQVPVTSFPQEIEVWGLSGERLATIASIPLAETAPVDGVRTGPRGFQWRPGDEATVVYVEALDGGDNRRRAEVRDRIVSVAAPFTTPVELGRLANRYAGIQWGRNGLALVSEFEWRSRQARTWRANTTRLADGWRVIFDRSSEDRYADPGRPVMTTDAAGRTVLLQSDDGNWIYLQGPGASPQGDRPFLARMHLENRKTERLWQSPEDAYESVAEVLDTRGRRLITRRETSTAPANYFYVADVRSKMAPRALTAIQNPSPELASVRRELVTYPRADGVGLSGTLYYPTGYQEGQKVPVVFWIYPREFASADAAGQVSGSPHRFVLPGGSSHLFLLTQGYAVLDNPTLPVVGGDTANNTYVEQTVAGAKAAIDYLMARGMADGNFGVGGHSYGAFATANLLAHSDLFKAGVARSGAYNRTLTPFGFQSERRTFWEARDVYLEMMPFTYAHKVNEPILMIHGMADNNSGTFPIQSERMYAALMGHGAVVEYVQLPFESHGYAARESVMDVVARMIEWFDKYVKGSKAATE
jgi:dipeptidyl aminopeptidase/acylaminoacyl peptidase